MFLKSLTLKGFKSFADPTTLEFEPGVTVVVGPNGSGKSNVVDAVAWVLGAQGPRVVRSSKMDDVIFAGTSKRPALGRAEVSLTIDNASGRLPIGFSEVTVTRTLFRTGESEYAINGAPCRLLDVQELLSDAGVGRQQHVIVGQGQLDQILQARPEDRRMVLEEAAGVLKYRRRRERAERRLESSESGLARLEDLLREVRRQLKPLERQAASALRHDELLGEERAIALYLAGCELAALDLQLVDAERGLGELEARERELTAELLASDGALEAVQLELSKDEGDIAGPLVARLSQLEERAIGMLTRCGERRRALATLRAALDAASDIEATEAEAAQIEADLVRTEADASALLPRFDELADAETRLKSEDPLDLVSSGSDDADPALFEVVASARAASQAARESHARAREAEARLVERAAGLERRRVELTASSHASDEALRSLRDVLAAARVESDRAESVIASAERRFASAATVRDGALGELRAAEARVEVLEMALDEARARAGVARLSGHPGVLGTLLDVVEIEDGYAPAFEAAVAAALDAVLVEEGSARAALEHLRRSGSGGAVLPVRARRGASAMSAPSPPPPGTTRLRARVHAPRPDLEHLLDALLEDVLVCRSGLETAIEAALAAPRHTIVTVEGERLSPHGWHLGSGGPGATRAALDLARSRFELARVGAGIAEQESSLADGELGAARQHELDAGRALDRGLADVAREEQLLLEARERLAELDEAAATTTEECAHASRVLALAAAELAAAEERLVGLERAEADLAARLDAERAERRARDERTRAVAALRRDLEVQAAALEERRRGLLARRDELGDRRERRRREFADAAERRPRAEADDRALGRLEQALIAVRDEIRASLAVLRAEAERRALETRARLGRLSAARTERERLERALAGVRERRQRLEIGQAEARVRHEAAVATLARDLESVPAEALEAPRPPLAPGVEPAERGREIARELRLLGPVNPLAREELAALVERSAFLETQLEDVRSARRELNQVIRAIDSEIVGVFAKAFADVEAHFATLFSTLFPGGEGRLTLTAPDDLLSTGVEIEARPAGRNVRRLSLLSGGERSLVALAFLFAVFRSRPSPFYLMDEVEAALDEVNLRRFLTLVGEFRDEAQLVIVSHQKKTMEIADSLYGITMQPGGASKAVNEKLRRGPAARPAPEVGDERANSSPVSSEPT